MVRKREALAGDLSKYFLLYVFISFVGWVWEVLYLFFASGNIYDRGFLTLPLCPIYATVLLCTYFALGTIKEPRGILKHVCGGGARVSMYLCLSFLLPTIAELLIGFFFVSVFNLKLWDYSHLSFNNGGHIALEISLMWALAIFLFMNKLFLPIKRLIFKIPKKKATALSVAFITAIIIDTIASIETAL